MPKKRVVITQAERLLAYEHAIHDLTNTIANIRQIAQNGMNNITDPHAALERIEGFATGRLTTTSEKLEPVYRGFRWEVVESGE